MKKENVRKIRVALLGLPVGFSNVLVYLVILSLIANNLKELFEVFSNFAALFLSSLPSTIPLWLLFYFSFRKENFKETPKFKILFFLLVYASFIALWLLITFMGRIT